MGNTYGIRTPEKAKTHEVAGAVSDLLARKFPGVFFVRSFQAENGEWGVGITYKTPPPGWSEDRYCMVLWEWDYEPTLWGGNSMDLGVFCGTFDWWVQWWLLHNLAARLGGKVHVVSDEELMEPDLERVETVKSWLAARPTNSLRLLEASVIEDNRDALPHGLREHAMELI